MIQRAMMRRLFRMILETDNLKVGETWLDLMGMTATRLSILLRLKRDLELKQ